MRILIADDDLTSRVALGGVLKKSGYHVLEVADGVEAWEILRQDDAPQLVILDWMMPNMDGPEVLRRVRDIQTDNPPYIIMLTSKGEKADMIACLNAGANDFLSKPFDPGELIARVRVGQRMIELQRELVESKRKLLLQATHDPLTGLPNRRALFDSLGREIERCQRNGNALSVGMCDIDHFKKVNDLYGHQNGDDVLKEVSRIMQASLRKYDMVGRIGGEEFLVTAPMKTNTDCKYLFERLRKNVEKTVIKTRTVAISVTISIGVACMVGRINGDELIKYADAALYEAKNSGRNRVVIHDSCF